MNNTIDLQIQSTASDGASSPVELVQMAKEKGLAVISLTDHDTVGGVFDAFRKGEELGVKVIPGIEISCQLAEHEVHILGYGIDYKNAALLAALKEARDAREKKSEKIVEKLQEAGFKVTIEDVLKQSQGTIARPNIAAAVMANPENKEKLGGISSVHEFIEAYLVTGKPTYVDRAKMDVKTAISLIHGAGGVAIWSHPAIPIHDLRQLEEVLKVFISYGLDGLEAFNPSETEDEVEFLNVLAGKYALLRTAGSDYHSENDTHHNKNGTGGLGGYDSFGYDLSDIVPTLEAAILKRRLQAEN